MAAIAPPNGHQSLQSPGAQSLSNANGTSNNSGSAAAHAAAVAAAHPQAAAQQQAVAAVAAAQHQAQQQHQMALFAAYGYPVAAATAPVAGQMIPGLTDLHSYGLMALTAHSPQLSMASPTIPTSVAAQTPLSIPNSTAATNPMLSAASFLPTYLAGAATQSKPIASVRPMSSVKLEVKFLF